ncbi:MULTISPECIES: hypothetical protein [unclassified Modestobacter]|uniref:hypothetical protein n=1 Tax=unclassified Modestobacter TaxID=2643866 RepID=UPI0022AAFE5D|nr:MULTISPECIES: hypothetical protein [unclassified Modestobacter]MCZ2825571.1 hypothetical protein [Modestobacter sp. VKM Ac-2981]MCZ2853364.1 hypothetical protein [Modestobacter sp. VKM Ac-2982]
MVDEPTNTRAVGRSTKLDMAGVDASTTQATRRQPESPTDGEASVVTSHDTDPSPPSVTDPVSETGEVRTSGPASPGPTREVDRDDNAPDDGAAESLVPISGTRRVKDRDGASRSRHRAGDLPTKTKMQFAASIAALVVIPTAVAYATATALPDVHEARAEVLVTSQAGGTVTEQTLATQVTLLTSSSVLGPVARALDMDTSSLTDSVSVERVNDSQVLGLSVTAEDADRAVDVTTAIVTSYLAVADTTAESPEDIDFLRSRLQELNATLADLDARIAAGGTVGLTSQREILISQIGDLQMQLTTAEIGELQSSAPAEVITEPYALPEPVSPQPARAAVGGFVGGALLAALATAFFVRRTREDAGA